MIDAARERQAAEGYLKATGLSIPAALDHLKRLRRELVPEAEGIMRGLREIQKERRAKRGPRKQKGESR